MSLRPLVPTVEQTLSILADRIRHLETAEKWQLANIRVVDHFAAQGDGSLANPWSGPGDDNFTSPMQLAAEALPAAGGVIYMKAGHYGEQDGSTETARKPFRITNKSNIIIWAEPGAVLHQTYTSNGGIGVRIYGSETTPSTTLTGSASPGDWSVAVTSAAGFAVGDRVMLEDTKVHGNDCLAGEIHRIRRIVGSTIYFEEPVWDEYQVARTAKLTKLNLNENIQVHNLTIVGDSTSVSKYGILSSYTENLVIRNVKVLDCVSTNYNGGGMTIGSALHALIENSHVVNAEEDIEVSDTGHGIMLAYATQFARVVGCSATRARHGFALAGSTQIPGRPRENLFDDCESGYTVFNGFDAHEGAATTLYRDCVARHSGNGGEGWGWYVRAPDARLERCRVINGGGQGGMWFRNLSDLPTRIAVLGGSIECDGYAIRVSESNAAPQQPHSCESIRIEGVDMKPGTHGIVIDGNDTIDVEGLVIVGNTIRLLAGAYKGIDVARAKGGCISENPIRGVGAGSTGIGIDLQGANCGEMVVDANSVQGFQGVGAIGVRFAGSRNLIVGNNLFLCTLSLSDIGSNNRTASNLIQTGGLA